MSDTHDIGGGSSDIRPTEIQIANGWYAATFGVRAYVDGKLSGYFLRAVSVPVAA